MDSLCTGEIPCTVSHTGNQKGASIKNLVVPAPNIKCRAEMAAMYGPEVAMG